MMRTLLLFIVIFACAAAEPAPPSTQPLSAEEAMQRLKDRQSRAHATRNEKVIVTRGELDDLRAQIAELKAEIAQLKDAGPAADANAATSSPKFVLQITTGVTRSQLMTFYAMHRERYMIARDVRNPDKQELITLQRYVVRKVSDGYTSNGVSRIEKLKTEKEVLKSWELVLVNDVITEIGGGDEGSIID